MEKIKEFLTVVDGDGSGSGSGSGYGYGDGSGYGYGDGSGYGYGDGSGDGYGSGDGSGSGDGYGSGDGSGSGYGYGDGSGYGSGYGYGISSFDGKDVHLIDDIQTIITHVRGNVAKGFILNEDLTLTPCYVVKGHNKFAHGETLEKAMADLEDKIFEDMDTDEAIDLFIKQFADPDKKYPAKDFFIWHNRLTGSCEMGRNTFVKNGGYDLEHDTFTVWEFISITRNAFGGEVIRRLEELLKCQR